jgi:hypothetical protein
MPYIPPERREELAQEVNPETPGELNFLLVLVINRYLEYSGESYTTFNDVVGALECQKLEFYRRLVAEYEDMKLQQNGDVY